VIIVPTATTTVPAVLEEEMVLAFRADPDLPSWPVS
jgi:hypothetical protein